MLERTKIEAETLRIAQAAEEAALSERLEKLRNEVSLVSRIEREAQELYRERKRELDELVTAAV